MFSINGKSYPLNRSVQKLPAIDLMAWLEAQPLYPKVFWKELDSGVTRAAIGNLLLFPEVPQFTETLPYDMRLYGGIRFSSNSKNDNTWHGFPSTCFWLPEIEISQNETEAEAIHYSSAELLLPQGSKNVLPSTYSLIDRQETPSLQEWQRSVQTVLELIASKQMDKLVLARKTTLQFANVLSPWPILRHLFDKAKHTTLFAFQLSPTLCFLGATPEKLFKREGNQFHTDAIAATRPRGKTPQEDLQFEQYLLTNGKEQREFKIVKDYLDSSLIPLCDTMQWEDADRVLKGSHVQHLFNRLSARLKNSISDADLIRALHPTPALGGYPREESLQYLKEIEPFDRGWYGAPIGIIGNQSTSLHVAIRSALIRGSSLNLFAGTGLVPGSIAEREWEELEQKIRPFTELFIK